MYGKIIEFLSGKKTTIVAIIALIVTYLLKENIIDINLAGLLDGILVILAGGANIATTRYFKSKARIG